MDPQDLVVIGEQVRPRRRRRSRWPFVVGILCALVVCALAWLTFVGYDTTVQVREVGGPMPAQHAACSWAVAVDGRVMTEEYGSLPVGTQVRIHRQLFHSTTYTFLAANGQRIPLVPGGFRCGVH